MSTSISIPLIPLLLLPLFEGPEEDPPEGPSPVNRDLPHPTEFTITGEATAVVVARLNDDVVPDVALLQGGDVYVLSNPDRHNFYSRLEGSFHSLTRVSLPTPAQRDGLLATTDVGVELITWNAVTHLLTSTGVPTSASWAYGQQLQTVRKSPSSPEMVCAISGSMILSAEWTGTGLVPQPEIDLTAEVFALAGLYWDGDDMLDFAWDDGAGLRIICTNGPQPGPFAYASGAPQLLRLPVPGGSGSSRDNLVWLTGNPGGTQVLAVMHGNSATNQITFDQALPCNQEVAARLTLADFDGDGKDDLVVTRADQPMARVLYRQPGSVSFGLTGGPGGSLGRELDLSGVWGSCSTPPAAGAGDLDGDGDGDMIFAGHGGCQPLVRVTLGNGVQEIGWKVFFKNGENNPPSPSVPNSFRQLRFWPRAIPAVVSAANGTHLRIRVWAWEGGDTPIGALLASSSFLMLEEPIAVLDLVLPPSGVPTKIYVEVCFEQQDAGQVVKEFPAWQGTAIACEPFPLTGLSNGSGGLSSPPPTPPRGPNP